MLWIGGWSRDLSGALLYIHDIPSSVPGTFLLYCFLALLALLFTVAFVPETKGMPLEEIEQLFHNQGDYEVFWRITATREVYKYIYKHRVLPVSEALVSRGIQEAGHVVIELTAVWSF